MNVRTAAWAGGLLCVSAVLIVLGCGVGSQGWSWGLGHDGDSVTQQLLWEIRVPRNLGAWIGGALLGLSGAVAQGLFRNPLADPYLLGSSSGASLGVSVALSAWGGSLMSLTPWERWSVTGAAFLGAMVAVALTLLLARGMQQSVRLLLSGVVVGVVLAALASLIAFMEPRMWQNLQTFLMGSTSMMDQDACGLMSGVLVLSLTVALGWSRVLDALNLGEDTARSLGMPLSWARWGLVCVLSLATGTAVAQLGLIAFIGLAAPHAVRSIVRSTHAGWLCLSTLMGGVLLLASDLLSRLVLAPEELPVGVVTSVVGGGYLLWRMQRSPQGSAA